MSDEFCTGVKILLARMESNPEEFVSIEGEVNRWDSIVRRVNIAKLEHNSQHGTLTVAEVDALYSGLLAARRKEFDDEVMRELLTDETELSYPTAKAPKQKFRHPITKNIISATQQEMAEIFRQAASGITVTV